MTRFDFNKAFGPMHCRIKYANESVMLVADAFAADPQRVAFRLQSQDMEPIARVNIVPLSLGLAAAALPYDCIMVKTHSENEGMAEWLATIGFTPVPEFDVHNGYVKIPAMRMPAYIAEALNIPTEEV